MSTPQRGKYYKVLLSDYESESRLLEEGETYLLESIEDIWYSGYDCWFRKVLSDGSMSKYKCYVRHVYLLDGRNIKLEEVVL